MDGDEREKWDVGTADQRTEISYFDHTPLLHQLGFLGRDGAGAFFGAQGWRAGIVDRPNRQ